MMQALQETLQTQLSQYFIRLESFRDEITIILAPEKLLLLVEELKQQPELQFIQLTDITAVDYGLAASPRFAVVYHLYSLARRQAIRLKVLLPDVIHSDHLPELPSLTGVWQAANWLERETYDMFGIRFTGHPNLTRILMTPSMQGYPLRKDFPLHGPPEWPVATGFKQRINKNHEPS